MLHIVLIREAEFSWQDMESSLTDSGHRVTELEADVMLPERIARLVPDVIIIAASSPSRDVLEHVCVVSRDTPRPIVMFTNDGSNESISGAIKAGVSAYVVDGFHPNRLAPIMGVARARFEAEQSLKNELDLTKVRLKERQLVEKAKGILMRERHCDEETAYQCLRKSAMDNNKRIGDVAAQLIQAHQMLHG